MKTHAMTMHDATDETSAMIAPAKSSICKIDQKFDEITHVLAHLIVNCTYFW